LTVWLHYVGQEQRHRVLCIRCWHRLTEAMDGGAYQAEHGGPLPLWSDQWRGRHFIAPDVPYPMPTARLRRSTVPSSCAIGQAGAAS
jgi:hypothetical protein